MRSPTTRPTSKRRSGSAARWRRAQAAVHGLARGVRRARRLGVGADRGARGDVGAPRTARRAVHGRQLGRADASCATAPRSSSAGTCRRSPRRGDLVPGLLRARGRLGPGVAAHQRARPRRLPGGWSAGRRSGRPTPPWRSGASCWPARRKVGEGATQKKQQGLTIFLVPMDDPAIQVRPIRVDDGPAPPQRGVLRRPAGHRGRRAGHRRRRLVDRAGRAVLRAGRHRPLRPLRAAAAAAPDGARRAVGGPARRTARPLGAHAGALPAGPAAGLPAWSRCRAAGRVQPGDAAGLPDRGDQTGPGQRRGADGDRRRRCRDDDRRDGMLPRRGRGPLAVLAGVHGVVGQHRDAAHPAVPRAVGGGPGDEPRTERRGHEYGRQALRAFEAAGGDQLVQQAEANPAAGKRWSARCWPNSAPGTSTRAPTDALEAAAALCRSAGYWALPYPVAERLARPHRSRRRRPVVVADTLHPRRRRRSAEAAGPQSHWTAGAARSTGHRRGRPGVRRPRSS